MRKKMVIKPREKSRYPSAELMRSICFDDYTRVIKTYDKIYDKVNITLAFSGAVLLVIVSSFDYTILLSIFNAMENTELFCLVVYFICSVISSVLMIYACIRLLLLMKSRAITTVDVVALCNKKIYEKPKETASLVMVEKYGRAIEAIKKEIAIKQKRFDSSVMLIIVAVICYAIALVIKKGL